MKLDIADFDVDVDELKDEAARYKRFAIDDPVGYTEMVLGINLWGKQQEIIKEMNKPCKGVKKISVASGNGVGKTFLIGALACNYSDSRVPSYVVLSGASAKSISKTVWPTLRKVHHEALVDLGGEINKQSWERDFMWEVFWTSPDVAENFGGFRTENGVLIIIDEASNLSQEVHDAIVSIAAAQGSIIIYFGNPIRLQGPFRDTFTNDDWVNFTIDSHEVIDLGIPGLATRDWIEERKREWGESDPRYKARVLGIFPEEDDFTLIPLAWHKQILVDKALRDKGKRRMGVDVARYGTDDTVFVIRDERCMKRMYKHHGCSLMETAGLVQRYMKIHKVKAEDVAVDDTGVGGGVTDRLEELGVHINAVNFGASAIESEHFLNRRAEMYWSLKKRLDPTNERPFFIPREFKGTLKQTAWTKWEPSSDNRIKLQSKDKIKKILGSSPDESDALALTFVPAATPWKIGLI